MRRAAAAAVVTVMVGAAGAPVAGAVAGARVGVLIADHGEPPEYNEFTYGRSAGSCATRAASATKA